MSTVLKPASDPQTRLPGASLAARVVRWQQDHGRHDLPWQNTRDPYRVWLSEVMLQQTQVATVRAYFLRFLDRFPTVQELARAPRDDVLALWSGLGYYSRARNLHACAQAVVAQHGGSFPRCAEQLQTLPGIGRSTAAAIAALCFGQRVAILDGNVKRVLARVLAFDQDLASAAAQRALWDRATELLPPKPSAQTMQRYTQGMMDLGATVCLPRQPRCAVCPLRSGCQALAQGEPHAYPVKTRKLRRGSEALWLLVLKTPRGQVWLRQRPTPGVWAGLYCFEVFSSRAELQNALPQALWQRLQDAPAFTHVLTHKDLHLHPVCLTAPASVRGDTGPAGRWFGPQQWPALGLPAPVRKLLSLG